MTFPKKLRFWLPILYVPLCILAPIYHPFLEWNYGWAIVVLFWFPSVLLFLSLFNWLRTNPRYHFAFWMTVLILNLTAIPFEYIALKLDIWHFRLRFTKPVQRKMFYKRQFTQSVQQTFIIGKIPDEFKDIPYDTATDLVAFARSIDEFNWYELKVKLGDRIDQHKEKILEHTEFSGLWNICVRGAPIEEFLFWFGAILVCGLLYLNYLCYYNIREE